MQHAQATPHWLDVISESNLAPTSSSDTESQPSINLAAIVLNATCPFQKNLRYWDIYVDDFCGLRSQGNKWQRHMVKRILFQALDKIFLPLDNNDTPF